MSTSQKLSIGYINTDNIKRAVFTSDKFSPCVYGEQLPDHHKIYEVLNDDNDGENFYVFYCEDCYSPPFTLVRASSWEEAYEVYTDWAAKNRGLAILECEEKDYYDEHGELVCSFTSDGTPVDTESVNSFEVKLERVEF
jgi:hypothetical protein